MEHTRLGLPAVVHRADGPTLDAGGGLHFRTLSALAAEMLPAPTGSTIGVAMEYRTASPRFVMMASRAGDAGANDDVRDLGLKTNLDWV
jgi:hypothetical protein